MNIEAIAIAAAALLSPYLTKAGEAFAGEAGKKLAGKIGELYNTIKTKFKGDSHAEKTLDRLEQKPESERRQAAVEDVLIEMMEQDPEFAEKVRKLVEESEHAGGGDVIKQRIDISGKAGDIFQIGKMTGGSIKGGSG